MKREGESRGGGRMGLGAPSTDGVWASLEMRPLCSRSQQPFLGVGLDCFLTSWFSRDAAVCVALNHFKSPYFS